VRVLLTVYSHCASSGDKIASQHTRRGTPAGNGQACRADLVAATGQFSRPPAGSFMASSGQFLVTAVTAVF
jgi:hypothetical protein